MGLESGSFISDLDDSWPEGGDGVNRGDDHIRLIKEILKIQFQGDGGGFDAAIVANPVELNYSQNLTGNIQNQFDAIDLRIDGVESDITSLTGELSAPTGTSMVFYDAAPPAGWELDQSIGNHMMRIVDGSIIGGGAKHNGDTPISNSHVHSTAGHVLTAAQMPAHTHIYSSTTFGSGSLLAEDGDGHNIYFKYTNTATGSAGSNSSHSHGNTGTDNWTPSYVNMILANKT